LSSSIPQRWSPMQWKCVLSLPTSSERSENGTLETHPLPIQYLQPHHHALLKLTKILFCVCTLGNLTLRLLLCLPPQVSVILIFSPSSNLPQFLLPCTFSCSQFSNTKFPIVPPSSMDFFLPPLGLET
jgi:hypothetical protein